MMMELGGEVRLESYIEYIGAFGGVEAFEY